MLTLLSAPARRRRRLSSASLSSSGSTSGASGTMSTCGRACRPSRRRLVLGESVVGLGAVDLDPGAGGDRQAGPVAYAVGSAEQAAAARLVARQTFVEQVRVLASRTSRHVLLLVGHRSVLSSGSLGRGCRSLWRRTLRGSRLRHTISASCHRICRRRPVGGGLSRSGAAARAAAGAAGVEAGDDAVQLVLGQLDLALGSSDGTKSTKLARWPAAGCHDSTWTSRSGSASPTSRPP